MYYITFLRMEDIAARVHIAEQIYQADSMNELVQRRLTENANRIKEYLLAQPQRFFNALVIGSFGGMPQWYELSVRELQPLTDSDLPPNIHGALGLLVLQGEERLFAIDGQHRVVGIQRAIAEDPELNIEEVACIFVSHRMDEPGGLERTRRLFTALNRNAKPVTLPDIIALDEDDVVAIVTRMLVEEHRLFRDKTSILGSRSIPPRDNKNFTTIVALYQSLDYYLPERRRGWQDYKRFRPPDNEIESYYNQATNLWSHLVDAFEQIAEVEASRPEEEVAGTYRHRDGGHLLFRPIGLVLTIKVIKNLVSYGTSLEEATGLVAQVPMALTGEPWTGLLWNSVNRRMITSQENQKIAERLMFYSLGGDLASIRTNRNLLREAYAGALNRPVEEVNLPRFI